jgi:hypothetical protein
MAATVHRPDVIRLSFASKEHVVVDPANHDRFVTTASAAAEACRQALNMEEFQRQFEDFLAHIHTWSVNQAKKVRGCYVTVGDNGLNVLVCVHSDSYDFTIEDAVADLDQAIFDAFPKVRAEVIQLPNQTDILKNLAFNSPNVLVVYGDGITPPKAS